MSKPPFIPTAPGQGEYFSDAAAALERVQAIYDANTNYLRARFQAFSHSSQPVMPEDRVSGCYPYVAITTNRISQIDSRLAYGSVPGPGRYATTLTRPDLFADYYLEQFKLLIRNHSLPIEVGVSHAPIPVHFAFPEGLHVEADLPPEQLSHLQDAFDVPQLAHMDDSIVNGTWRQTPGEPHPLALFTAARVDYSLHRLRHYTATGPHDFQNFVIFTNYQFYIDEFMQLGQELMSKSGDPATAAYRSQYTAFVEPGGYRTPNRNISDDEPTGARNSRLPQMPAYHLQRGDHNGITMVNIGVGPSNAKTITDHIAVLRPHAWLMLGHCAGLRGNQRLGDYVLAHGYVRDDHVLDDDLPTWVPVPALAEIQRALEQAVADATGLSGYALKSIMRTGTVATIDNRNWELRGYGELVQRFSQSRAIALDMESATVAANGFRFRVPYGTLLCVSDKPFHGEIKLPGMANRFYRDQVDQHLKIGIRTMEILRGIGLEQLHSRKLRSFVEVAFQ